MEKNKHTISKYLGAAISIILLMSTVVSAAMFSIGFRSQGDLLSGMTVSLLAKEGEIVEAAHVNNDTLLAGVVANSESKLLELSKSGTDIQVVTEGEVEVLVSTIAGEIQAGDQISASPIAGIAKKADNEIRILGIAQEDFLAEPGENTLDISQQLRDQIDVPEGVYLGSIRVFVNPHDNPAYFSSRKGASGLLSSLSSRFEDKDISDARIISALIIFAVGLGVSAILLYSAIRSSLISVGRNPLSKRSIFGGMWQVIAVSMFVLVLSITAVYFLLS